MKTTALLILAALGATQTRAKPNGLYHQEYQYKSTASSYKNNELQHKNDDEGFYSKQGDLEGRLKPKINQHDAHSEYVNPRLREGYSSGADIYDQNQHLSSASNLGSSSGIYDQNAYGSNNRYGYGSSSNYGASNSNYGSSSSNYGSLQGLTQRIEQDMAAQLSGAVAQQFRQSSGGYSTSSSQFQNNIRNLEEELKRNLTMQLQNALRSQYGTQAVRGGYSYSIKGGQFSPTANYNNEDLTDLTARIQNNLMRQLNQQSRQYSSSSSSSYTSASQSQNQGGIGGGSVSYIDGPYPGNIHGNPHRPFSETNSLYSDNSIRQSNIRYTPVSNPESVSTIASRVQTQLNNYLNEILESTQNRYLNSQNNYYSVNDIDNVINNYREDLKRNLTMMLQDEIRRNYGSEIVKGEYSYSVASNGQHSPNYNYKLEDYENLRRQVENNLLTKLNRDFQSIRQRFTERKSSASYTSTGYRPTGGYSSSSSYGYGSSYQGGAAYQGNSGYQGSQSALQMNQADLSSMQSQLQDDLSRQLQAALRKQQYQESRLSSASGSAYNANANYENSLRQLSEELRHNLTQQLDQTVNNRYGSSAGSGYSYSSGGQSQLANLRSNLQEDLMRQLRQGLQQSFSAHKSFSSSSSSSNYGSYGGDASSSLMQDDCCMQADDASTYHTGGPKNFNSQQSEVLVAGSNTPVYTTHYTLASPSSHSHRSYVGSYSSGSSSYGHNHQQTEDDIFKRLHGQYGSSSGQSQIGLDHGYHSGRQHQSTVNQLGQEEDNSDLVQQTEGFGNWQAGNHKLEGQSQLNFGQHQIELGQQEDTSDLVQQTEDNGFENLQTNQKPQVSSTNKYLSQQEEDSSDLVQQTEDSGFGNLQIGSHKLVDPKPNLINLNHQGGSLDFVQQTEDSGYGNLQTGSHRLDNHKHFGQQEEDTSDLVQQTEDSGFGNLQIVDNQKPQITNNKYLGQTSESHRLDYHKPLVTSGVNYLGQQEDTTSHQIKPIPLTYSNDSKLLQTGNHKHQYDLGYKPIPVTYSNDSKLLQTGNHKHQYDLGYHTGSSNVAHPTGSLQIGSNNLVVQKPQVTTDKQEDTSDLVQQTEDSGFGNLHTGSHNKFDSQKPQIANNKYLGQSHFVLQTEDNSQGNLQTGSHIILDNPKPQISNNKYLIGQQGEDTSDLMQQTEENSGFGNLQIGNQRLDNQKPQITNNKYLGQSHFVQRTNDSSQGNLQTGSHIILDNSKPQISNNKYLFGQQEEDTSDLIQQTEDNGFGNLNTLNNQKPQITNNKYLGQSHFVQHTADSAQENLHTLDNQKPQISNNKYLGQQEEDTSDLFQQTEDNGFGNLETGNHRLDNQKPQVMNNIYFDQQEGDTLNPVQQTEGNLQIGSHKLEEPTEIKPEQHLIDSGQQKVNWNQQEDTSHLVQSIGGSNPGKPQFGQSLGQHVDDTPIEVSSESTPTSEKPQNLNFTAKDMNNFLNIERQTNLDLPTTNTKNQATTQEQFDAANQQSLDLVEALRKYRLKQQQNGETTAANDQQYSSYGRRYDNHGSNYRNTNNNLNQEGSVSYGTGRYELPESSNVQIGNQQPQSEIPTGVGSHLVGGIDNNEEPLNGDHHYQSHDMSHQTSYTIKPTTTIGGYHTSGSGYSGGNSHHYSSSSGSSIYHHHNHHEHHGHHGAAYGIHPAAHQYNSGGLNSYKPLTEVTNEEPTTIINDNEDNNEESGYHTPSKFIKGGRGKVVDDVELLNSFTVTTTEAPGFWKKLKNSASNLVG